MPGNGPTPVQVNGMLWEAEARLNQGEDRRDQSRP